MKHEQEQILRRTDLLNDKDRISYIYLLSHGIFIAFYKIKGKVSSVNSRYKSPDFSDVYSMEASTTVSSPALDGSYGSNGDAMYFFTEEGNYVEWAGSYLVSDTQLKLRNSSLVMQ